MIGIRGEKTDYAIVDVKLLQFQFQDLAYVENFRICHHHYHHHNNNNYYYYHENCSRLH